jgi:non-ribosomal peptide synthetase component F
MHDLLLASSENDVIATKTSIASGFERQAATTPEQLAVVSDQGCLTYRELNA